MNSAEAGGRAAAMRAEFDRTFAEAARTRAVEKLDFLAIRLGGDPFAVRIGDTAGLFSDRKITAVPSLMSEFRGIAGVRGAIVPVFDLAALLGYPGSGSSRWLLTARDATVAFLVDDFEGQIRADADALVAHQSASRAHVRQVLRTPTVSRPVVHLPSLVEAISRRNADTDPLREG